MYFSAISAPDPSSARRGPDENTVTKLERIVLRRWSPVVAAGLRLNFPIEQDVFKLGLGFDNRVFNPWSSHQRLNADPAKSCQNFLRQHVTASKLLKLGVPGCELQLAAAS